MDGQTGQPLETPSGKGAGDENFPVGSALISRRLRPHVAVFYAFARAIDDIADNPVLAPEEKIARLERMAAGLRGAAEGPDVHKAVRMRDSLLETGVPDRHGLDLISAFKQDAVKARYADWFELMDYCDRSAAPVGRYLLDLHGESRAAWPASDALCRSLQVINHLQDCADDYRAMDRVYLPLDWMAEAGARVEDLGRHRSSPALRRVLDRCIAGCRSLNAQARALAPQLESRRLAAESAVIAAIAERLTDKLARRDPVAERVELTKPVLALSAIAALVSAVLRRG